MRAIEFRVQNYRSIEDSGWIKLEQVTAFVGRNESGKTTLLKALHKFNPATPEPYDPLKDFPRDRYTIDYVAGGSKGGDWPVCSVRFALTDDLKAKIAEITGPAAAKPEQAEITRYYDGSLSIDFIPELKEELLAPKPILDALTTFARAARRLESPAPEQADATANLRKALAEWATGWQDRLKPKADLRNKTGAQELAKLKSESESKSSPQTADMVEALQDAIAPVLEAANRGSVIPDAEEAVEKALPVLIYFENYGILDSAIYLPRFLEDLNRDKNNPRVRTINAMFKHVGIDAKEIENLGKEDATTQRQQGHQPTPEIIAKDQRRKEERAVRLNSASIDISKRFSEWWSQRRHKIRYHADGEYFRIWIADDRRPDVEIELEARSKGFQWFFSFYLVFLVESEEGHKDAILLLDEPGLNLHPTAQQELIGFFENLSKQNQLLYTTHSPFLIDGDHLHRVRPVIEDSSGHARINAETWPSDRETIFPLQAAAGYAMVRGLFQHKKNVLLEGMSDYYYLHALNQQCRASGRQTLPDDIYLIPCGGTKLVGHIASLFLGQEVRPVVLLDGDDAGRARRDALLKELYAGHSTFCLMLDDALERSATETEVEDIFGEAIILPALNAILPAPLTLTAADKSTGSLPSQIKAASTRLNVSLPDGWKATVSLNLVTAWATSGTTLPASVLDMAQRLFGELRTRFV